MEQERFTYFWRGPFSQWHICKLKVDSVRYTCAEQYMMACKARYFGDQEAEFKIMELKNPRDQKAIGRLVKGFDAAKWNEVAKKFVYEGNLAKFGNNPTMTRYILETGDKEIVEASPYDTIWGIGLGAGDPKRFDKAEWLGTNWLGEVLMDVRKTLRGAK